MAKTHIIYACLLAATIIGAAVISINGATQKHNTSPLTSDEYKELKASIQRLEAADKDLRVRIQGNTESLKRLLFVRDFNNNVG